MRYVQAAPVADGNQCCFVKSAKAMRNKEQKGDLTVQAIAGTHVVLLGIDLPETKCPGLLGFALRREDHTEGEKYWLSGYKTFASIEPSPPPGILYSTRQHPIQGFTWSDFSAKPEHDYTYEVFALRGTPANPNESEKVAVDIRTESEHGQNASCTFQPRRRCVSGVHAEIRR
jgi:hypothetical protein